MDNTVSQDDWFHNIDLMSDPALGQFQGIRRQDYITATLASYGLRATNSEVQQTLDFNDDIWDLHPFFTRGERATNAKLIFEDIPEEVRLYFKFFLNYYRIKEKVKISTLYLRYSIIKNVIKGILELNPGIKFDDIDTQMIINYIESKHLSSNDTKHNYYISIFKFYDYLIRICDIPLLVDIKQLAEKHDRVVMAAKKEDNRLPNIPEDVAKEIRSKAISVMRDADAEYVYRLVACAIIMLFNLGVRIGDLLDFRIDNLKKEATEVNGIRISYIDYYIQKLSRHNTEAYGHTIFASEECVEAFETMKRIRLTQPAANSSDHLFVYKNKTIISRNYFGLRLYPDYMIQFHSNICTVDKYKDVFSPNTSCWSAKGKALYYPDTRQYRVYLCTDLYAKGVSWNYIEEHMKHLSSTMEGYYNRPEDKTPEYIAYAENVLREMLVNKVEPIGLAGKEIRENIDKFLMQKQVNAVKDFDQVLSTLGDKISIRAKTGGFCFKTSFVPCSQEQGTNKILCAYNLCPNVYSFYYMLDYTYSQFLGHIEAFEQNYMKGLKNSAEKELVEIKSLIFRALEPQVKQLEAEILKKGMRQIIEQHQNLIDVITNLESIKKQIVEWKQKTVK